MRPPSVHILDTTLREGELNPGVNFTPRMMERIAWALAELGTPRIEFSVAYPRRGDRLREVRPIIDSLNAAFSGVTTIVQCRAVKEDVDLAQMMEARGCGVYIAVSEEHRRHKLNNIDIDEVMGRFAASLDALKEYGFEYRRAVLEDASRYFSQYRDEEDSLGNIERILKAVDEAGATTISLPDTSGLLDEPQALEMFEFARGATRTELAAHFHNDYGNALGNTKAVVRRGLAEEVHVSIYGLGSGAGIADHYEVSANLMDNLNVRTGEDRDRLKQLYLSFQEATRISIPWNHPLSDYARMQKAGTHQAQQLKSPKGYIPPKKLIHDFDNTVLFEASQFMSTHLVRKMLEVREVEEHRIKEITEIMSRRAAMLNRALSAREIRSILKEEAHLDVPASRIGQLLGPERAFYLLKIRPKNTGEICEMLWNLAGVERVLETFGEYDIIVEAEASDGLQKSLQKTLGPDLIEMLPLAVG